MTAPGSGLVELVERAVLALERIAGALAAEPLPVSEKAVLETLAKGASLRSCARIHGCKVGIVRGIRARALAKVTHNPQATGAEA